MDTVLLPQLDPFIEILPGIAVLAVLRRIWFDVTPFYTGERDPTDADYLSEITCDFGCTNRRIENHHVVEPKGRIPAFLYVFIPCGFVGRVRWADSTPVDILSVARDKGT
jgi:hypothetical protein